MESTQINHLMVHKKVGQKKTTPSTPIMAIKSDLFFVCVTECDLYVTWLFK